MKEYTFTITVEDFSARILLGGEWSLYDFADFITRAVGFHFDHLFEFLNNIRNPCKSTERYSLAADMGDSFDDLPDPGVKNTMVSSVFTPRKAMLFHFDFGDDWWFLIRCDSITDSKARRRFFKILSTKGTPPEQYPDLEGDDDDWEEEMDEEPAIPRAVAGKKPGKTLDQLIAEMAGWPEDWSTFDKKTRALATGLVREFEPFLRHLGEGGLAPKTLKNHHDNLWLLGELIIRDAGRLGLYTAPSAAATLDNAITGGEGPMIDASRGRESSDQRDLERTTRKLAKFRGLQVW